LEESFKKQFIEHFMLPNEDVFSISLFKYYSDLQVPKQDGKRNSKIIEKFSDDLQFWYDSILRYKNKG
jgi:hypothetical protein